MRPHRGGHAWVFLQWLLGLRDLGFEVRFVDRSPTMDETEVAWLANVMSDVGFSWALTIDDGDCLGASRDEVESWFIDSDVCIDVMGHADRTLLPLARRSVMLDIDPGFGQMWHDLGQARMFGRHHAYATIGLTLGEGSMVPTCGVEWIPTLPPVALPEWPRAIGRRRGFTSVSSWRGPFDPVAYGDEVFGLRVHQFRKYFGLPALTGIGVELALDIDDTDVADRDRLIESGFTVRSPRAVAATPHQYRSYVQQSGAELCVAKDLYVRTRCGWFSDRSACYLASGRPVVHHDTGFGTALPVGDGLLTFSDPAQAAAAMKEVVRDPDHHTIAARQIAEEHLDATTVIARLLDRVGVL
jgi:hypothetical protein